MPKILIKPSSPIRNLISDHGLRQTLSAARAVATSGGTTLISR